MAIDDAGDDVGEVAVRFGADELARFDQRRDHGPVLSSTVGPGEQGIFSIEG
jgi:hypothetical protein